MGVGVLRPHYKGGDSDGVSAPMCGKCMTRKISSGFGNPNVTSIRNYSLIGFCRDQYIDRNVHA